MLAEFPPTVVNMKPFFLFGGLVSKQERHFTRRCRPYPRKCAKPRPFDKVSVAFTGGKLEGIKDMATAVCQNEALTLGVF